MPQQVAIRLGTSGKGEVKSDFAEIGTAGASAMRSVADSARLAGDVGEQQAQRLATAYERAANDVEAADRRRAAAAQKLAAFTPATPMQAQINSSVGTGFGDPSGSARQSAVAFAQLIAAEEQLEARTRSFLAALDPTIAAQQRFDREIAEARTLVSAGTVSLDQYCDKLRLERGLLEQASTAHGRTTASAGAMRAGMQQVGFQFSDAAVQIAGGTRASLVFAQQAPQVVQAVQMMSGGTSKFAAFMGSGWGVGILIGVSVLGALISKMTETDGESAKLKATSLDLANSLDRQRAAHEDLLKAIDAYNDRQKKATENTRLYVIQAKDAAEIDRGLALAKRLLLAAQLELQKSDAAALGYSGNAEAQSAASQRVVDIQVAIRENQADIAKFQSEINSRTLEMGAFAAKALDPLEAIRQKYSDINTVIQQGSRNGLYRGVAADKVLVEVGRNQRAEEAAARAAQRDAGQDGTSSAANVGDMKALLRELFGPGTYIGDNAKHSRMTADGHVSDHALDRALDFVPQGGMGKYTSALVEKMLKDAGVDIRRGSAGNEQFFGPGMGPHGANDNSHAGHFHVAWQGSPSPERAASVAERERDKATRREAQFASANADADQAILDAKRASIVDEATLAQYAKNQIQIESDKYNAAQDSKVALGDLTKAQRDELVTKHAIASALKAQQVDVDETVRKTEENLRFQSAQNDNMRDILQGQQGLATTAAERLPIALRLLAMDKEEERRRQQEIIDRAKIGQATAEQASIAQDRLNSLDTIYGQREQGVRRENESPVQAYLRSVNKTGAEMDEQLQQIKVNGLQSFTDGLADAIVHFKSLGDVAKNVLQQMAADLLRLELRKGFTSLIGGLLGGGGSLSPVNYGALSSAAGSVRIPGFASGTESFGGGMALVGEMGPEIAEFPAGTKINTASRTRRMLAANNNSPVIHIDASINAPGADAAALARVEANQQAMARELPGKIIATIRDASDRGLRFG